jgi:hypothetical protein
VSNLALYGAELDKWAYNVAGASPGYTVSRDITLNPFGTSNLVDRSVSSVGAYGGFYQNIYLEPDTRYEFSCYAKCPTGKSVQFGLYISQAAIGTLHWIGNNNEGYGTSNVYATPSTSTWTKYTWVFTTPSALNAAATTKIVVNVTGAPSNNPDQAHVWLWGMGFFTVVGEAFAEPGPIVLPVDFAGDDTLVPGPSVDLTLDGNIITTPFDPARWYSTDYNLFPNGLGCEFLQWTYTEPAYAVERDVALNPTGSSNKADRLVSAAGAYGGFTTPFYLIPGVTYSFSIWLYSERTGSQTAFRVVNTTMGTKWWGGPSNSTGFSNAAVYAYPPVKVTTAPWTRYTWTFTAPNDIPLPYQPNATFGVYMAASSTLVAYGASLTVSDTPQEFVEPSRYAYDSNSYPYGNPVVPEDAAGFYFYPSIDLLDSEGNLLTTPFDINRLAVFTRLGKYALPYGNTFDMRDEGGFVYDFKYSAGHRIISNYRTSPVDALNNPIETGYSADLLQPPESTTVLTGCSAKFPMPVYLTENQVYTLSCWVYPEHLNGVINLKVSPSGTWSVGEQPPESADMADPSWKALNGFYQVVRSNLTGTYGNVGDLGIPKDIPSAYRLTETRGSHVRVAAEQAPVMVMTPGQLEPIDLHSVQADSNATLVAVRDAVLLYQELQFPAPSINASLWVRHANDYTYIDGQGSVVTALSPTVTGAIAGWGLVYQTATEQVVMVYPSYSTMTDDWRYAEQNFSSTVASDQIAGVVGYGVFLRGDVAIYGGLRLYDNTTQGSAAINVPKQQWTRVEFPFTATLGMENVLKHLARPGTANPLTFSDAPIVVEVAAAQPGQPKIGQNPDPAYLPWTNRWAAVSLYGLMINEGPFAGVYYPDPVPVLEYAFDAVPADDHVDYFSVALSGIIEIKPGHVPAFDEDVQVPIGINVTGNRYYSTARIFLNIMKMSNAAPYREGLDPTGVWDKSQGGWFLYRGAVSGAGARFNCFDTRIALRSVVFTTGGTSMTVPREGGGSWWDYNSTIFDKGLLGTGVAAGTKITSHAVGTELVTFTVDTPFTGDSDPAELYYIKREPIDHLSQLNPTVEGYPTYIPSGYKLHALAYRNTAPWNYASGMMNHPYMKSGRYVLKWEGTGVVDLSNPVGLYPGPYPATEVSRSGNRIVYDIDCSGNTTLGQPVHIKYAMGTDVPTPLWTQAQSGFLCVIHSTDPLDPVHNLVICEGEYEAELDGGETFYPEWLDRLKWFKCIRYLDWCGGNTFQPFADGMTTRTTRDHVSWSLLGNLVPWEVIIEQCNRLKKDCWINLHPNAPDDYQEWIAQLFCDTLDPTLRLYVEFGNEQWNGGLGTGYWLDKYVIAKDVPLDPLDPNPSWTAHLRTYARLSQHVFGIWDSVFSGHKALLHPVRQWEPTKTHPKRLIRVLSTMEVNPSISKQVYEFAAPYCTGGYGIPFDAIASNGYYADMLGPDVRYKEALAKPDYYQWSMEEALELAHEGLTERLEDETHHKESLENDPSVEYPAGYLGQDAQGEQFRPSFCLYEGGMGSPGPSPYMLDKILKMLWEEDGESVVYNSYMTQMAWWKALVDNPVSVYNVWETPMIWGASDQWGIADKSFYSEAEYYSQPRVRALAESSGLDTFFGVEFAAYTGPIYPAAPVLRNNDAWDRLGNVRMYNGTEWVLKSASILQYRMRSVWN